MLCFSIEYKSFINIRLYCDCDSCIVYSASGSGVAVPHGMTATMLLIVRLEDRLGVSPLLSSPPLHPELRHRVAMSRSSPAPSSPSSPRASPRASTSTSTLTAAPQKF